MRISSPAFADNHEIPVDYTCDGENINPPLIIADVPEEAQSLVLIVDDPDAPSGIFTHWLVWNIEPSIEDVSEGEVPQGGVEGENDGNEKGYTGPCPPSGTHRYFFHLYALDKNLDLKSSADRGEVEDEMDGHVISETQFMGLYSREEDEGDSLVELGEEQEE